MAGAPRSRHRSPSTMLSIILFLLTVVSVHGVRRQPRYDYDDSASRGRRLESQTNQDDAPSTPPRPRATSRFASTSSDNDNPNPDEHLVTSMPLLPDGLFPTRHWAGHLPADGEDGSDKKIFYWLFEPGGDDPSNNNNNNNIANDEIPLLLWLNGGPGCSSMDGLWLENGPFRLKSDDDGSWTIDVSKHSWHNAPAWTLYVDQPVG